MDREQLEKYRARLKELGRRIESVATALEGIASSPVGGEAAGNLSNVPMHLGDLGSEVYTQELNATLLENEQFIQDEVDAALARIDQGTYGKCEECGRDVPEERLEALPYARYCARCAEALQSGRSTNLNEGRPEGGPRGFLRLDEQRRESAATLGEEQGPAREADRRDSHAAGTPGGGTAIGGLAGIPAGSGSPAGGGLEEAMASGRFDAGLEEEEEEKSAYGGPQGGAVGGTPAGKRATGGKTGGGIRPQPGRGDSPTGQ